MRPGVGRSAGRGAAWLVVLALAWTPAALDAEPGAPAPAAARDADPAGLDSLLQLRGDRDGAPITIESDELELRALPDDGRVLLFERNVRVVQGDVELRADFLEAHYPSGESEPSRLAARGNVQVDQPGQRAWCAEAEYLRDMDRLTCRGDARLERACDVVRGDSIELDLGTERARVIGGARVEIRSRDAATGCRSEEGR